MIDELFAEKWWIVLLGMRPYGGYYYKLGRETFLVPARWEDDWLIASPGTGWLEFEYLAKKYPKSVLSVSVDLSDVLGSVARRKSDSKIDALLDKLASYDRPVSLHLAFTSADTPDVFVSAWKKFHERIQAKGSPNAALVWESDSCEQSNMADWYPGDEFVDWVGMSYCDGKLVDATIQFVREHLKPVMLTAAPSGAQSDWNTWFAPLFKYVNANNDVVRAMTYTGKDKLDADILKRWKEETKRSFWLRASPSLFDTLGQTQ